MNKIGIFSGTETGTTRLIAKKIHARLGDEIAAKPLNVNRIEPADLLQYHALILGAQERFASSLRRLHDIVAGFGAEIVGGWSTEGYTFEQSASVVEGRFVGLVIDQRTQGMHTEARLDAWVAQVRPLLLDRLHAPA